MCCKATMQLVSSDRVVLFPHLKHRDFLDGSVSGILALIREHNLNRILDNLQCEQIMMNTKQYYHTGFRMLRLRDRARQERTRDPFFWFLSFPRRRAPTTYRSGPETPFVLLIVRKPTVSACNGAVLSRFTSGFHSSE